MKKLINYCIESIVISSPSISEKIESSGNTISVPIENLNIEQSNTFSDLSKNENIQEDFIQEDNRLKFLENISVKIAHETTQVNTILDKLNTFRSNISKVNKNLESLRKYKNPTKIPNIVQSERPRTISRTSEHDIFSIEECKKWIRNKLLNPKTNRKIEENGPTYTKLQTISRLYKLI
jgi:hypothetical protein